MKFLPLVGTRENAPLTKRDPDGVYRCTVRITGRVSPYPTFYKRGDFIKSNDWVPGWRGEVLGDKTYFSVEFLRSLEEGDPI